MAGGHGRSQPDIGDVVGFDRRQSIACQLPLLVLNGERKFGFVRDVLHVEDGDDFLRFAVAELEGRRQKAPFLDALGEIQRVKHFQRRCVDGRRARILRRFLEGFEDGHGDALAD